MLIIRCPECQRRIFSDLLTEIQEMICPHCQAQIPVSDIQVSANGLTFERNDLVKNLFRYKKMLLETVSDRELMINKCLDDGNLQNQRVDLLIDALQGVAADSRTYVRYQFAKGVDVGLSCRDTLCVAKLVNLSLDGCRLVVPNEGNWLEQGEALTLDIMLGNTNASLQLSGTSCWARSTDKEDFQGGMLIGVVFESVSEIDQGHVWSLICSLVDLEIQTG